MRKALFLILFFIPIFSKAHPMPNSVVTLKFNEQNIVATLLLPLTELESAIGKPLNDSTKINDENYQQELKEYIQKHLKIQGENGQFWKIDIHEINFESTKQPETNIDYNELSINILLTPPSNVNYRKFTLFYDIILHQVFTHSALLKIEQDWKNGIITESKPLEIGVIAWDIQSNTLLPMQINLEEGSLWKGFKSMFSLGMKHIWEGTDHLLFLFVLLLPSPLSEEKRKWAKYIGLKSSLLKLFRIITAFTIGHSITLIFGTLGWINFSTRWIEILITISILISALNALFPIFYNREIYIAGGFGLIHGLAFSNTLANLELTSTQMGLSILGFNLGIEAMQLFIMSLVLPCLLVICRISLSTYKKVRLVGVAIAIVSALAWLAQRVTNNSNFITNYIDRASEYLILIISLLIIFTIWIWVKNLKQIPLNEEFQS